MSTPMPFHEPHDAALAITAGRLASALGERAALVARQGFGWLEVHLAGLPRKVGREPIGPGPEGGLSGLRRCDVVAAALLAERPAAELLKLWHQGDREERLMLLMGLRFRAVDEATADLLVQAHRSNDQDLFEAAFLDQGLPAASLPDGDFANGVLKAAFLDLPLARMPGVIARAHPELSGMLLDFMAEREAAGRPTWAPSLALCARAPVAGVAERVMGDLWHGVDARRLAAAEGARVLRGDERVLAAARSRLPEERWPPVQELLTQLLA